MSDPKLSVAKYTAPVDTISANGIRKMVTTPKTGSKPIAMIYNRNNEKVFLQYFNSEDKTYTIATSFDDTIPTKQTHFLPNGGSLTKDNTGNKYLRNKNGDVIEIFDYKKESWVKPPKK